MIAPHAAILQPARHSMEASTMVPLHLWLPTVLLSVFLLKGYFPRMKGYFAGVCVRLLRRMYLSMYWGSFTHLQLMRGWNR